MSKPDSSPSQEGSIPLRVRFGRRLWLTLLSVWGFLIVDVGAGTIANLNTTTTDTPLKNLFIIHLALAFPLPVFSSIGTLIVFTLVAFLLSREPKAARSHALSEQNRAHMLRRLRVRYEQMLAQSLQGVVQIELGLASRPAAVQNAASLSLRLPNQPEQSLPPHTSIREAYTLAQQELLILGEPGAGKSTLLLELAYHLVELAETDAVQPLPVLLPLSSWAIHRPPLEDWLASQVALLYDIPRDLARSFVQAEVLLPLLDGFDEMEEALRPSCIAAINTYYRTHLRPLVVCSRTTEHDAATKHERLALHTAIIVQPLSKEQVDTHLATLGKPLTGLRTALKKNAVLQEVTTTPLLLQVLILTYHGTTVRSLPQKEALLREQIWIDYVERMVTRKGNAIRYPPSLTTARLRWLASQMREHNLTIFNLEQLQPDWLPTSRRLLYRWSVGLVGVLVGVLLVGLFFALIGGPVAGLVAGLAIALPYGLGFGLFTTIEPAEALVWSWEDFRSRLFAGLRFALVFGLVTALLAGLFAGLFFALVGGLVGVLVAGLVNGLIAGFSGKQLINRLSLSPNEGIRHSLKHGLLLLTSMLGVGMIFGMIFGMGVGLFFALGVGMGVGLLVGIVGGLDAVVQHYTLRIWLWRTCDFPLKIIPFLEDATARILLRRVGGGYSFVHRLLLDHFADLPAGAPSSSPGETP